MGIVSSNARKTEEEFTMRRLILVAVAVAALVGAVGGSAATTNVAITKAGFVPADVRVQVGDTVTWTNTDTVAHQVAVDRFACNLTIQPGATGSCTFTTAGKFNYRDPAARGNAFRGSVEVVAPSTLTTLAASRTTVIYGQTTTLSGQLTSKRSGEIVELWAQAFGQSAFLKVTQVTSTDNGSWTVTVKPTIKTVYQVRVRNASSQSVTINVKPKITLGYSAVTRLFTVRALAASSFAGKVVTFQRRSSLGQWVSLKKLTLNSTSTARFRATLPKGRTAVRAILPATQTLPGYLAGVSPVRYVTR
jgi:plastocyanin